MKMLKLLLAASFSISVMSPALADKQAPSGEPERFSFLTTFGDEKCPEPVADEIVVCATAPEGDRYRIPKKLRETEEEAVTGTSWTSAVESLDEAARGSRPNSCSVDGSNGFTGCTQAMLRQWFAERRESSSSN